jgi:hypothetical protein
MRMRHARQRQAQAGINLQKTIKINIFKLFPG